MPVAFLVFRLVIDTKKGSPKKATSQNLLQIKIFLNIFSIAILLV